MLNATPIKAQILNASPQDATFLKGVLALFTDPQNAEVLETLRTGQFAIIYDPQTGRPNILAIEPSAALALPADMINFVARFDHAQWQQLASTTNIKELVRQDIELAEARAREVLGFLPEPAELEVANG